MNFDIPTINVKPPNVIIVALIAFPTCAVS